MDILHLIDRFEELVAESKRMPVGQSIMVDRRRLLELIDQMRSAVPWEVREAKEIVATRDGIIDEAKREGDGVLERAEMEAQAKVAETSIVKMAEEQAANLVADARTRTQEQLDDTERAVQARLAQAEQAANNQMDEADRYALEILRRLMQQLDAFSTTVRAGVESLESKLPQDLRD
jgi:cell division septum initiation protein DivIVA